MDKQTSDRRRGTVFVYGLDTRNCQHSDDTLNEIKLAWPDWRVVVVSDGELATEALTSRGWHKDDSPQLRLPTPYTWKDAQ
jgi:hypothetical protein